MRFIASAVHGEREGGVVGGVRGSSGAVECDHKGG